MKEKHKRNKNVNQLIKLIDKAKSNKAYFDYLKTICIASHKDPFEICMLEYQKLEQKIGMHLNGLNKTLRLIINKEFKDTKLAQAKGNINLLINIRNYFVHYALVDLEDDIISRKLFNEGLIAFYFYVTEVKDFISNYLNKNSNDIRIYTELNGAEEIN